MVRQIQRGKKYINETLEKDWSGSLMCGRLVRSYLQNKGDHMIFTVVSNKLDENSKSLELAAQKILQISGQSDHYMEAVGLVRISRQIEIGLAEIAYIAELHGRGKVQEEFDTHSLFFQAF
jgi:hypothetical protein